MKMFLIGQPLLLIQQVGMGMILMRSILYVILITVSPLFVSAQKVEDYLEGEKFLYAETKQVNQFFRRFNGEENENGVRLAEDDNKFRNADLRKSYMNMLFDNETAAYSDELKKEFVKAVVNSSDNQYLNFHKDGWFAEVNTEVAFNGKPERAILFLKLEQEKLGYKWVFDKVFFAPFTKLFDIDTVGLGEFMHPMSHELDFMNLRKVFNNKEEIEEYAHEQYQPDYLSLFLYEIKNGSIAFRTVKNVKFHFFQIKNWYFEISEFNRSGYNKGWLISNLVKVPEEQKDLLINYIYFKQ